MADEWKSYRVIEPGWGIGAERDVDKEIPGKMLDMEVTQDLKRMYQGFSRLLAIRAMIPTECRKPFDAVTMCMRQKLDRDTCKEVYQAWRPCDQQVKELRALGRRQREQQKREEFMAKSRALEKKAKESGGRE